MSSLFEQYTDRVTATGESLRDRYEIDTKNFINKNFADAPTYRRIKVWKQYEPAEEYDVRVNMIERMGNIRSLLFRPDVNLGVGNMAEFEGRTWLLYDKYGFSGDHIKMTAMRTNYNLKWIDANGVTHADRCYASASDMGSKSKQNRATIEYNKYDVRLPYGQLYIFMETTEHSVAIDLNHRFIINNIPYEVIGLDNTTSVEDDYGIIQFTIKRVPEHPKDDFELGIAYNSYLVSEQDGIVQDETEDDIDKTEADEEDSDNRGGGILW